MDLARTSVFLDFDGTITRTDTGVHLLERLAPRAWREVDQRYEAGVIGSRECILHEWSMVSAGRARVEAVVREVPLDEGFEPLVTFLRSEGAEVTILSDGFGIRAHDVGRSANVPVICNRIEWESRQVVFSHGDPTCECAECGVCKRKPLREARARGRTTVLVGDGMSDLKAVSLADVIFAKGALAESCTARGVSFGRFGSLTDVLEQLQVPTPSAPGSG